MSINELLLYLQLFLGRVLRILGVPMEVVVMALHIITNVTGITTNSVLLYAILRKSPKVMRTYSILMLNFCITDLVECIIAIFIQQRLIPAGLNIALVSYGPCRFFGVQTCLVAYSGMLSLFMYSLWNMLASFIYRWQILCIPGFRNNRRYIFVVLVLLSMPCWILFITFPLSMSPPSDVAEIVSQKFPAYDFGGLTVYGIIDILRPMPAYSIFFLNLSVPIVFGLIILTRRKIIQSLSSKEMSAQTKSMHSQLLRALTYQACVPLFVVVAASMYLCGQLEIYHSPLLEHATFLLVDSGPVFHPFITLSCVRPYNDWLRSILHIPHGKNKPENKSEQSIHSIGGITTTVQ